jgi:hypothetical protein
MPATAYHRALALGASLCAALGAASVAWAAETSTPAAPDAPPIGAASPPSPIGEIAEPGEVPMDHQLHAGQYKIPCLACHVYADKSSVAGIPSARKCMGCHKMAGKEKRGVQILAKRFEQGQSLRWKRVYEVPDFIYFSHRVHVLNRVDCKECHGDVAASQALVPYRLPFTMGRCLECHEKRQASRDCLACHK